MVFSTDDDDCYDPRQGMVFSTDDPVPEKSADAKPKTFEIINTFKEKPVELTSSRAGTNNPAYSRLPVEDRHLIIAH